jgi:hypothetical protein
MYKIAIAIAFVGLSSAMPAAGAETLNGSWTVTSPLWRGTHRCTFQQAQNNFTLHCVGPHGQGDGSGAISGAEVTWDWQAQTARRKSTWRFAGKLTAEGRIVGTLEHGARRSRFSARRPELS